MRYIFGEWNDTESLKSRIIVSAGGAGSAYYANFPQGGHGGAITGYQGIQHRTASSAYYLTNSIGATNVLGGISGLSNYKNHNMTMNGSFGIGALPYDVNYGSGGGGGYYGGGAGNVVNDCVGSGSGGSSFISGYKDCDAIAKEYTLANPIHTGTPYHYSGYVFSNPTMKDGVASKYTGNGQARITVLFENYLQLQKSSVHHYSMHQFNFYFFIFIFIDS
ncbi:glycine-rich protein, putative [Trichomonas vaginalis G3]|uniref:receptor protein-tyrosine kinase n=1 Tax=Trichomonas vaginalis (strain ATCC PRA-98 / G3) TaxID=412133 RepID=A2FVW7_TRIV3|nr:glycine-rich protein family [Trichomonas vaginalis G3]EAX90952.1 glycine-rich protein, putative [Trichomonas vaginalis G3]KAI5548654.1 glycine-rich protein family [Trichomonas vaginalis G3]|eukprot:XP_001303882.1 glycine-rich protein [Trichomonas vaginalis G3]